MALSRRGFLAGALRSLLLSGLPLAGCAVARPRGAASSTVAPSSVDPVLLSPLLEHLLPSEPGAPGALDVGAPRYLNAVLGSAELHPADRDFLLAGFASLSERCDRLHDQPFVALTGPQREVVLREIEAEPLGEAWLEELLGFLLEALLGPPGPASNPDRIGWRWLGVQGGFPLPPLDRDVRGGL